MPTGYTRAVYEEDRTLKEFFSDCLPAFVWELRDCKPGTVLDDELLQDRKPDIDRYLVDLAEAKVALQDMQQMSRVDLAAKVTAEYTEAMESWDAMEAEDAIMTERFTTLRAEIEAWACSELLSKLKQFMLEQIDGEISSARRMLEYKPRIESSEEYKDHKTILYKMRIANAEGDIGRVVSGARKGNEFLAAVRAAFKEMH